MCNSFLKNFLNFFHFFCYFLIRSNLTKQNFLFAWHFLEKLVYIYQITGSNIKKLFSWEVDKNRLTRLPKYAILNIENNQSSDTALLQALERIHGRNGTNPKKHC